MDFPLFNPYNVGTAQRIADLPLFSGATLRLILCLLGPTIMAWYNISYFKKIKANPEKGLGNGLYTSGFSLSKPLEGFQMTWKDWLILSLFVIRNFIYSLKCSKQLQFSVGGNFIAC